MAVDKRESRLELTAIDKASAVISQVKGSVDNLRSSIDTVKGALEAVGITVGAGALLKLHADLLKANAELQGMSERTGASVEGLSQLQQVAKIGGRDFDGFADQLGKMIRGLKSSDEDGQKASAALRFLGVAAKSADGSFRDTAAIVSDIALAMRSYADDGNKVALIQDALGKGAERYLPFLKDLAEETGVVARITAEQASQAESAEKNINRLVMTMGEARRELVIGLTPAIVDYTNKLIEATKASGGLLPGLATMATASTADIDGRLKEINSQLAYLEKNRTGSAVASLFTYGLSGIFNGVGEGRLVAEREYLERLQRRRDAESARAGAADPNSPLFEFGGQPSGYQTPKTVGKDTELTLYTRAMQQLEEELGKLQDLSKAQIVINRVTTGSWKDLTDEHKAALIAEAGEFDDRKNHIAVIEAEYGALTILIQRRQQEDALFERSFTSNKAALDARVFEIGLIGRTAFEQQKLTAARQIDLETKERTRQALDALPEDAMSGDIMRVVDQYAAAGEAQKRAVLAQLDVQRSAERSFVTGAKGAFNDYAESATNAALQARLVFGNAFQNMEDALVAFGRTGKADFRNFADAIINDIIRIQTRMYITGPLAQMGSAFLSGAGSSIGSALGFANGGVMSGAGSAPLTRYANGGVATSPQLAEFGEGPTPEAFVPLPDGRTIPVTMRGGMGGGDTYNIDARGADSVAIARLESTITQMRGEVRYIAIDAVQREAAKRGKRLW
jgi:lambda family phage tail tape measure protein